MPLNYQYGPKTDLEMVKAEPALSEAVIFLTMTVGMPEITDENWEEFYKRVHLEESVNGTRLNVAGKPWFISRADIQHRIGLETNASRMTRNQFNKKMLDRYYND